MEYQKHRFNSDGFCKDCGIAESKAGDPFCDGDEDPDAWIDSNHPAYSPNVAGYLAGIQYLAAIRKTPFDFELFRNGLKGGARVLAMQCSFHSLGKRTMRLTIPHSHMHLVSVFANSLHREVMLNVANVAIEIMVMPDAKAVGLDAAGGQSHTSDGLCTGASSEKEQ